MAEPFLGEIRIFSFGFAPKGWAFCQGQTLPINQNQALFSLLGTMYGGNGQTTFLLPNATNSFMIGFNNTFPQGQVGGEITHTLLNSEIPTHLHTVAVANTAATSMVPGGNFYAVPGTEKVYTSPGPASSAPVLAAAGGSQPHNNMQPSLALNFCIALQGIFPSRN